MTLSSKQAGKIAAYQSVYEMRKMAAKFDAVTNGRIDFSGTTVRLCLNGEDLSQFLFNGANLSGSRFTNCTAEGSSFRQCVLNSVRVTSESGHFASWEKADFSRATITDSYFGPRTLNLQDAAFGGAIIRDTKFMMADLQRADFSHASLVNVDFRNADLQRAKFIGSSLESVCLEKASLMAADFTDVKMAKMEGWGEPDYTGATIADGVRYRFAIVADPVASLQKAIDDIGVTPEERRHAAALVDAVREFAGSVPEAMLIYDEYNDLIELDLFVRIVKAAKVTSV